VPDHVADVVRKATAANPADRFASAQAMGTALARCLAALNATNKEREVSGALATLLVESADTPSIEPSPAAPLDGVVELEILEASGPIRDVSAGSAPVEAMPAADTRKMSIPLPPEAFPVPGNLSEAIRKALAGSREGPAPEQAVALFDQGLKLRLQGRYDDALAVWEEALRLAPDNHLYQAQIAKLRAHLASRRGG
jgi:tetratricopeptide (TPR) repeat protein